MNEDSPQTESKTQESSPPQRRPLLRRLWRWGLYLALFLVVLVIGLGVGLKYFFPFERLQPILEEKLSRQLNMPVKIGGLDLDLLNGIGIYNITLGHPQPVFGIDALVLDYDLADLLQGKLTIDQIRVDHPQAHVVQKGGLWNFQPLLELGGGSENALEEPAAEPPPPPGPTGLPPFPIAIDLKKLTLNNISASARLEEDLAVELEGLTLEARGSVDADSIEATLHILMSPPANPAIPHNIVFTSNQGEGVSIRTLLETDLTITAPDLNRPRVAGTLGVRNNSVHVGDPLPAPDLSLQIDGQADLKTQTASLKQLILHLGKDNSLQLSATVEQFLSDPRFQLNVSRGRFNIDELLQLAKEFVPPLSASGHLLLDQVQLQGSLKDNQPQQLEMKQGTLQLQRVFLDHPDSRTRLRGLDAKITLKDVLVDAMTPQRAKADIHLVLEQGNVQPEIQLNNLDQRITVQGEGDHLQKARVTLRTRLGSLQMPLPEMGTFQTGIALDGSLQGNIEKGDFKQVQLDLALGSVLTDSLRASARGFGKGGFEVTHDLKIDLHSARAWIPDKFLEPLGLTQLEGQTALHTRAQGALDADFEPRKIHAETKLSLNHLNAAMTTPGVKVNDFNLQIKLPAEYDSSQGVFIPQTSLKAGWQSAHALNIWELGPTQTSTSIQTDRFIPLNGKLSDVSLKHHSRVKVQRIAGQQPPLDLSGLELELQSKGKIHSPEDVRNLDLTGKLTLNQTAALDQIKAGPLQTDLHVQMNDLEMTDTRVTTRTVLQSPSYQQEELAFQLESLALKTDTRQNLKTGDVTAANIHLDLPGIFDLKVNGSAKNWGEQFNAQASLTKLNFARLLAQVPDAFKENLEGFEIEGEGALHVKAQGAQPTEQQLKKLDLPIQLQSQLKLSDLGLTLPDQGLSIKGLNSTTRLDVADNVIGLKGSIDFGQLAHDALPEGRSLDPRFHFNYVLDRWNRLEINETTLHINDKKIGLSLQGDLEGLRAFLTKQREPAVPELLDRLDVRLRTRLAVDAAALKSWLPDVSANGRVETGIDTTVTAGQDIRLAGNIAFKKFNARYGEEVTAKNIDGKLVFDKRLVLDRNLLKDTPSTFAASRKGYFNQLRDFSEFRDIFQVESLEAGGHRVSDVGLDIFFKDNRLFIEKFLLQTLGASVGGNLFLTQSERGPELSLNMEFANLDFNALVPEIKLQGSKDTQMDGNLRLGFKVGQAEEGERIGLDQLALQVNITRIGKEVLDRILLFLDPDESKPAIVDTRSKLQLASPHRVRIELENGNLSVAVTLYNKLLGGILKAPELKRIPITRLKHFKDISQQLQILAQYQELLQYLAARGIEFDEEGHPLPF